VSLTAQDWVGDTDQPTPTRNTGFEFEPYFQMSAGLMSRTDESAIFKRSFTFDSKLYYFPREYLGLMGGVLLEQTDWTDDAARATALGLDVGVRLQGPQEKISLFFEGGLGIRHYNYERDWYSISRVKAGITVGGGISVPLSRRLQADLSLVHHVNHRNDEIVLITPPVRDIPPINGFYYTPTSLPNSLLNPTGIRLAMRWSL
jgi:hypothetical protein